MVRDIYVKEKICDTCGFTTSYHSCYIRHLETHAKDIQQMKSPPLKVNKIAVCRLHDFPMEFNKIKQLKIHLFLERRHLSAEKLAANWYSKKHIMTQYRKLATPKAIKEVEKIENRHKAMCELKTAAEVPLVPQK